MSRADELEDERNEDRGARDVCRKCNGMGTYCATCDKPSDECECEVPMLLACEEC